MPFNKEPLELNADFEYALNALEKENKNLFITGRAGTGKSTLLQLFRNTTRKKVVVLAPTGIAALNVKGQTIHSFFGFPPKPITKKDIKKRRFRRLYTQMDTLIIDEISMVRADMLDNIDYFLRINREDPYPFGGVQVIFVGDLFQLPPVVASEAESMLFQMLYESPYFFSAEVFQEGFELEILELGKVYRQNNRHFLQLLEQVRLNTVDYDSLEDLNARHLPNFEAQDYFITLTARNATANRINESQLNQIQFPQQVYTAKITGTFKANVYPTEAVLKLKLSSQVMFVKNDPDKRFVNGTIGKIVDFKNEIVVVQVEDQQGQLQNIEVGQMDWEVLKYKANPSNPNKIETETLGTFTQYPLKLAWAITIHKAQGKTFDKIIIDLGSGAFEHGQTYVALSRCRTLEGIVLKKRLSARDIKVDERIIDFYNANR
ncbi:MAG: DEAD/DEAH box helicase [Bacteroidota bacterium]